MEKYQTRKITALLLAAAFVVVTLLWGILVWNNTHISKIDMSKYTIYESGTNNYEMTIESANVSRDNISITKDYITISGYLLKADEELLRVTTDVILVDSDTNEAYIIPTTMSERTDITERYGTHNFDWPGINVRIPFNSRIDTEKHDYKIMALTKINFNDAVIIDSGKRTGDFKNNE